MSIVLDFNPFKYRPYPTKRWSKPWHRISSIMSRLSKNRYMPPEEVRKIGWHIARKVSGAPTNSHNAAIDWDCDLVGMICGQPPLHHGEPGFRELKDRLEKRKKKAIPELIVLNVMIKTELDEQRRQRYAK